MIKETDFICCFMKFDIADFFWGPRLIISTALDNIKKIGKPVSTLRIHLPMDEFAPEHFYPRPQLVRDSFFSLDGEWDFANIGSGACPNEFDHKIVVPYPPQAKRSGIDFEILDKFWYRKVFSLPEGFVKKRVILHFGAVDQMCECFINGHSAGIHIGGYLPFSFDITKYIVPGEPVTLTLHVKDTCDTRYPLGKQVKNPGGMWYANISGIWQSVWLESVEDTYVKDIKWSWNESDISFHIEGIESGLLKIYKPIICRDSIEKETFLPFYMSSFKSDNEPIYELTVKDSKAMLTLENPALWTPETPFIYAFSVENNKDKVYSYFSLRTVSIEKFNEKNRICINHKPLFMHCVLDQGYFSDGLFIPPSDRYYDKDILSMKELGFNALRKHIKLEPAYFYYSCDKLGMLVFQDMINNGIYNYFRETLLPTFFGQTQSDLHFNVPDDTKEFFIKHSIDMINYLKGFSSIIYYSVFNEGWGQFDSNKVTRILKDADPTRIYDSASGWFKQPNSLINTTDVHSDHFYFHKIKPKRGKRYKPVVISECGGFTKHVEGHMYAPENLYGYGSYEDTEALTDRIVAMYDEEVVPNIKNGICSTVYTQVSDVDEEINGLYTYDRAICKVNKEKMVQLSQRLKTAFEENCTE
ncbi:MAG: hypothetical protein K6E13_01035 [Lachnospiraceae bacterium]|nr:hypothetical protein [Lachnospiraceae bacterium]